MDIDLIKKVLKETQTTEFKNKHEYTRTVIGENGEATLHPKLISILKLFRGINVQVDLFTNFSGMTEGKMQSEWDMMISPERPLLSLVFNQFRF